MYVSLILIRNVIQIFGYDQVYLSLKFPWNEIWIKILLQDNLYLILVKTYWSNCTYGCIIGGIRIVKQDSLFLFPSMWKDVERGTGRVQQGVIKGVGHNQRKLYRMRFKHKKLSIILHLRNLQPKMSSF